jgi:sigma-B regulation protein RsbU (phosphoserine phosphatase)
MPYHFRHSGGQAVAVEVVGYPLGMASLLGVDADYTPVEIHLAAGDALVLYSDGVVEAQNDTGDLYDEARLELLLAEKSGGADAQRLVRTIVDHVERFIGEAPRTDDLTAVVMKREALSN